MTKLLQIAFCAIIVLYSCATMLAQQQTTADTVNVVVYFSSGIQKAPVHITATHIQDALSQCEITENDISRTYPNFNEADTLRINAVGQRIISSNLSCYFTLKLRNKSKLPLLQEKLARIPEVVFVEFPDEQKELKR